MAYGPTHAGPSSIRSPACCGKARLQVQAKTFLRSAAWSLRADQTKRATGAP